MQINVNTPLFYFVKILSQIENQIIHTKEREEPVVDLY